MFRKNLKIKMSNVISSATVENNSTNRTLLFFPAGWRDRMANIHTMISTEDVECALQFLMILKSNATIVKPCNWIDIYLIPIYKIIESGLNAICETQQSFYESRHRAIYKLYMKLMNRADDQRFILFPICEQEHFTLIAVDYGQCRIYNADSFANYHDNHRRLVAIRWLMKRFEKVSLTEFIFTNGDDPATKPRWIIEKCLKKLQTQSLTTCGLMVCLFAINIVQRAPLERGVSDHNANLLREFFVTQYDEIFSISHMNINPSLS